MKIRSNKSSSMVIIMILTSITMYFSCNPDNLDGSDNVNSGSKARFLNISYEPVSLTEKARQIITEYVNSQHEKYDPQVKMITRSVNPDNAYTDATSGVYHGVRESFQYAIALLDLGDEQYTQRAFDIIEKNISLQDQDPDSKSCGVWPYYLEEPFATKKTPIDYNWADFISVILLEVWTGHEDRIPEELKNTIKKSLILAAEEIQRRNVGTGYTNICIIGTYVTYMVSNLFDLDDMKEYAVDRLKRFYDYTLEKGGFVEYNSPGYTLLSLDELNRMQSNIIERQARLMINTLYSMTWDVIARHYHQPSGQWCGPFSRTYNTLADADFYAVLEEASDGGIKFDNAERRADKVARIKNKMPESLMPYFLSPEYPRTETDVFINNDPEVIGTCYLADKYALATANRASFWYQRRPFLGYWGSIDQPKYIQVRLLHDNYDFASAVLRSQQTENKVLAGIHFITNCGAKNFTSDNLGYDGRFETKDLRLRFELGNVGTSELATPSSNNDLFSFVVEGLQFNIQLYLSLFDGLHGQWEKGGDGENSWVDFVIYNGSKKEFKLAEINEAILGFTFFIGTEQGISQPKYNIQNGTMKASWEGLELEIPVKPFPRPSNI